MATPKFEMLYKDTGFCRVSWKIQVQDKETKKHYWVYYNDQWDSFDGPPNFYRATVEGESDYKCKRPDFLPKIDLDDKMTW